jgi:hypothetical protein
VISLIVVHVDNGFHGKGGAVAIQFLCPNPKCGKLIQVPADQAGQQVSCPTCRQTVTAPAAPGEATTGDRVVMDAYQRFLQGLKEPQEAPEQGAPAATSPPQPPPAAAPAKPPPPMAVIPTLSDEGVEDLVPLPPAGAAYRGVPPFKAGWVPNTWMRLIPLRGHFARHCLRALRHPGVDAGSVLMAAFCLALLAMSRRCLLGSSPLLPLEHWHISKLYAVVVIVILAMILGGCCLSVGLALTAAATAGGGRMETWSRPRSGRVLQLGMLGMAVMVLYVLPVVTLPLLPLALLVLSLAGDGRAFSFRWQIQAAYQYGDGFAILWLFLVPGIAVVAVGWWLVNYLAGLVADYAVGMLAAEPEQVAMRIVIGFLGAFVAGVVVFPLICGMMRCAGLLARLKPAALSSLPHRGPAVVTWGVVIACVVVTGLLVYAVS